MLQDEIITVPVYSIEDMHKAAWSYIHRRTMVMGGVIYWKPSHDLSIEGTEKDEAINEVRELLCCSVSHAEAVLLLLKTSGQNILLARIHRSERKIHTCFLSEKGIREWKMQVSSPNILIRDKPITAEDAIGYAWTYEGKTLRQVRFLTNLEVYYLVADTFMP